MARFAKDLRAIKDDKLLARIGALIHECKQATNLTDLKNIRKIQGHTSYYRIRLGDYRIGLEIKGDTLIFVRCLHRREVYRYFP